jgi:CBS domain-containing protein
MAKRVREVMNTQLIRLSSSSPIMEGACQMREHNVGAVVVEDDGKLCGIVTDRDIVVRAVAQGLDLKTASLSEICSNDLTTVPPDDDIDRAVQQMREKAIRRIVVIDGGKAVGIVSLGDLAVERDGRSVLGQISAAPANH